MDGNGRWAQRQGLPRSEGHKAGSEAARRVVTACIELGVPYLTLYAFSKENWSRPKEETSFLFDLLGSFVNRELDTLVKEGVRLQVIGDFDGLPFATRQILRHAINRTSKGATLHLNMALNYSGRDELLRTCKKLLAERRDPATLRLEDIEQSLDTAGQPDPDLLIRTSGEFRISNFLLYQLAYSEFYFTDAFWPDFDKEELLKALESYSRRHRRFGATQEQIAECPQARTSNES